MTASSGLHRAKVKFHSSSKKGQCLNILLSATLLMRLPTFACSCRFYSTTKMPQNYIKISNTQKSFYFTYFFPGFGRLCGNVNLSLLSSHINKGTSLDRSSVYHKATNRKKKILFFSTLTLTDNLESAFLLTYLCIYLHQFE